MAFSNAPCKARLSVERLYAAPLAVTIYVVAFLSCWKCVMSACTIVSPNGDMPVAINYANNTVGGEMCVITYAGEGDQKTCQCPSGYILCNWQDVEQAAAAQTKPGWLRALSDDSDNGFKNTLVYVDYELQIVSKRRATAADPSLEYSSVSSGTYIDNAAIREGITPSAPARSCMASDYYLCKKVQNDKVNCLITEWSGWNGYCVDAIERRVRAVLRSGQHGGKECEWEGVQPRQYLLSEERPCPGDVASSKRFSSKDAGGWLKRPSI